MNYREPPTPDIDRAIEALKVELPLFKSRLDALVRKHLIRPLRDGRLEIDSSVERVEEFCDEVLLGGFEPTDEHKAAMAPFVEYLVPVRELFHRTQESLSQVILFGVARDFDLTACKRLRSELTCSSGSANGIEEATIVSALVEIEEVCRSRDVSTTEGATRSPVDVRTRDWPVMTKSELARRLKITPRTLLARRKNRAIRTEVVDRYTVRVHPDDLPAAN